ncbi:CBS domain-containing protein [Stieleria sp. JC731]|uniref:CBS domain-containing protein n=1 Tax=Pirellulaceae TaxID=2691357 RepID=UPI001E401768|nr:CBS domain-containing protein [Stieleria sp. JC731]MCC9600448.1 CBS domain-containing protein [Stieleria sp. JC731]
MNTKLKVKDLMARSVVAIDFDATVHSALDIMMADRLSCLPVVAGNGKCIGVLALPDLMPIASESDHLLGEASDGVMDRLWVVDIMRERFGSDQVSEFMSDNPVLIDEWSSVTEAAERMLNNGIHHLPVVNGDEELIGIISSMDLLRAIVTAGAQA